jgi:hypothetical protein
MNTRTDALCDALERLEGYEYLELPGPFAYHGPMGAEVLSTLGYDDQLSTWAETYKSHRQPLDPFPSVATIDPNDKPSWEGALGNLARVADWDTLFSDALKEQPWQEVLQRWLPRLMPGSAAGLTHGIIRTGHAVRALDDDCEPPQPLLRELARALAFWAAAYTPLPGHPQLTGTRTLRRAIGTLPRPDQQWAPMEAGTFSRMSELSEYPAATEALGPPPDPGNALSDLSAAFSALIAANTDLDPMPLVHTVTPIGAMRTLDPHLDGIPIEQRYTQLWRTSSAIVCGFTPTSYATSAFDHQIEGEPLAPQELVSRAVEHKDPHVLKFTEICVREHAINPDPIYLLAAGSVQRRVTPW